jgi:hypothetical protein
MGLLGISLMSRTISVLLYVMLLTKNTLELPTNSHPPPNLPLEGGESYHFPPLQGEGWGGGGLISSFNVAKKF